MADGLAVCGHNKRSAAINSNRRITRITIMKGSPKPVTDKSFRRKMMLKQKKEMRVNSRLKRGNETCKKFFFICPDVLER